MDRDHRQRQQKKMEANIKSLGDGVSNSEVGGTEGPMHEMPLKWQNNTLLVIYISHKLHFLHTLNFFSSCFQLICDKN